LRNADLSLNFTIQNSDVSMKSSLVDDSNVKESDNSFQELKNDMMVDNDGDSNMSDQIDSSANKAYKLSKSDISRIVGNT
jgi:hypothetical protein